MFGQFLVLALTWGSSFLFIKVGLEGFSPAQVVLGRLVAGAAALLVVVAVTRQRLPRAAAVWGHLAVVAVLLCVVPFLLFAWAELHVSSGFASICNATTPLMTTMVAWAALPGERPDRVRLAGLIAGFAGVVVVLGPWRGLAGGGGVPLCLSSSEAWGPGFVEGSVAEHGEQDVDALSGQAEEGLGVGFASGSALVVVGAGGGVVQGGERGEEHRVFELPVPASGRVFAVDRGP